VPVLLIMMSIERIGAGVTAQIGMLGPLSTIVLSDIYLNETLNFWMAAGTMLVLIGIWMLMVAKR
jgi:drug/metabolite transporter (DMT)-like permease